MSDPARGGSSAVGNRSENARAATQSVEAIVAHLQGIRVGPLLTLHEAHAMLLATVADDDPVVIIESRKLYQAQGLVDLDSRPRRAGTPDARAATFAMLCDAVVRDVADVISAVRDTDEY